MELSRTINLLDGLLKRHHSTVARVTLLDTNNTDQVVRAYGVIENNKNRLTEEIINKINKYSEGRRPTLKILIANKKLINEEDCLMNFVDKELQLMHENITKKYHFDVIKSLWTVVEGELQMKFQERLNRNLVKNKPSRFSHFQAALPVIINAKKGLHEDRVISDLALDTLSNSE